MGRFGRKVPFFVAGLALIGGGFGIAFTTSLLTLNVCRFVIGMARLALWVNGLVIGTSQSRPLTDVIAGASINGVIYFDVCFFTPRRPFSCVCPD